MKIGLLLLSAFVLMVGFNNCGQPHFSNTESGPLNAKTEVGLDDEVGNDDHEDVDICPEVLPKDKVCICHVPPGNPEAKHTILISKNALRAHFSLHKDMPGDCDDITNDDEEDSESPREPKKRCEEKDRKKKRLASFFSY